MDFDAFISYASPDKPVADAVCARLEAAGIRCWIAPRDIMPGSDYGSSIIDAIHSARVLILVFSGHANMSAHVPKEVERAMSNGVPIIPFRIENVVPVKSLDYFIGSVHWLDAMTPPLEQHIDSLGVTVRKLCPPLTDEERRRRQGPILGDNTAAGISRDTPPAQAQVPLMVPPFVPPTPSVAPPAQQAPSYAAPAPSGFSAGKIGAIAVAILVAIAFGYFFARPKPGGDTARDNPGATNPAPEQPAADTTPTPSSPNHASKSGDPIVGCYTWFNGGTVVIRANGTMSGGPFQAKWRNTAGTAYQFTWPAMIITVAMTGPSANALSGSNQYGYSFTGQKFGGGTGLAGNWHWSNGWNVAVDSDGRFASGPWTGTWRALDASGQKYEMTWPSPIDSVQLTGGSRINGANQYGVPISGTRSTCP